MSQFARGREIVAQQRVERQARQLQVEVPALLVIAVGADKSQQVMGVAHSKAGVAELIATHKAEYPGSKFHSIPTRLVQR